MCKFMNKYRSVVNSSMQGESGHESAIDAYLDRLAPLYSARYHLSFVPFRYHEVLKVERIIQTYERKIDELQHGGNRESRGLDGFVGVY